MNLWDFIKIKSSAQPRKQSKKTKRQPNTDKRLGSKIYKEFLKLNTQETNKQIKKWAEDMNRHFSNEDLQMANRHMKKMFKIISHQENTNQTH